MQFLWKFGNQSKKEIIKKGMSLPHFQWWQSIKKSFKSGSSLVEAMMTLMAGFSVMVSRLTILTKVGLPNEVNNEIS